ncbi:MAG TPA: CoB--CoM heterodisulfide reductase iron-sulfur subunit B family protein, partial [Acidobacteriota bacterium]|nr:CoB--CoM heterodisulfide reductase iron-sulfur subunit B family protein [Acidobacteriota bacterium]
MEFALLRCCSTNLFLKQYESSTDAVSNKLGLGLVEIKEFNCCGYPLKNYNFKAHVLASARNLSLAEKRNLNITTVCNCCYGTTRDVNHIMRTDGSIREEINSTLEKEGLKYNGGVEVKHFLEILYKDVGIERIKEKVIKSFEGLKIATQYGCHILRPRQIVQFDDPGTPTIFDQLIEMTGAESIPWETQLECCGSPMWGINDDLSMDLTQKKIADARESGADYLCVACPFCQLQFDRVQKMLIARRNVNGRLPSILYTQLLGLSLGIDPEALGINKNELDISGIL